MSTPAFLRINDQNYRRKILLYTHHSGYSIPDVVPQAFDVIARHYSWLSKYSLEEDFEDRMVSSLVLDRLLYGPSTAAVLIAARPCFLEPASARNCESLGRLPFQLFIRGEKWGLLAEGQDRFKNSAHELLGEWDLNHEILTRLRSMRPLEDKGELTNVL